MHFVFTYTEPDSRDCTVQCTVVIKGSVNGGKFEKTMLSEICPPWFDESNFYCKFAGSVVIGQLSLTFYNKYLFISRVLGGKYCIFRGKYFNNSSKYDCLVCQKWIDFQAFFSFGSVGFGFVNRTFFKTFCLGRTTKPQFGWSVKPWQNKKGQIFVLEPQKMVSFSQVTAVKKTLFSMHP